MIVAVALAGAADAEVVQVDPDAPSATPASIEWAEHIRAMPTSDEETRRQLQQVRESLAGRSFEEAETTAKHIVERVNAEFPGDTHARSRALHNLALVQHLRLDHGAAVRNYEAAIDVVVSKEDMLSADLVPSLHGLGLVFADSNRPLRALSTFDRALHVSNVNDGPHGMAQVPILLSMLQLHAGQGDVATASDVLDRIYSVYARRFERGSEELLPVIYRQAAFYREHKMYAREYAAWSEALTILRKHRGRKDLSLIEPQLNLGRNMIRDMDRVRFRSGPTAPSAEKYLKRALSIAETNAGADWRIKRKCLLSLADYYILLGMPAQGHRYYREAWKLLSDQSLLYQRAIDLEAVVPISRPHPDRYANFRYNPDVEKISPDKYRPGVMVAEFTVNRRGRVQDLRIISADPPDFERMEWRLKTALKDFVYRPRFVDGEAVNTEHFQYRLEYFYLPSEYQASTASGGN